MNGITDEAIMERVQSGALDELTELFDRYQGRIYTFFLRQCRQAALAEDLCQSVFERVIKYRQSYRVENPFRTWIYQIARNLYKDHLRKNSALFSDYTDVEALPQDMRNSVASAAEREQREALYEALEQLPPERKELLVMSKFQGLKYEEISEITGMTVAAIKVNVHRGLKQLRTLYFATS